MKHNLSEDRTDSVPALRRLGAALVAIVTLAQPVMGQADVGTASRSSDQEAASVVEMDAVTLTASADASSEGLAPAFAGGQVATGSRLGILGNRDIRDTPYNTTAYTEELIEQQQARGIGEVLLNDPTVRVARGFGNFQEVYIVRGFPIFSDDIAYNGLYGLLPRQYVATEFVERVEVVRGANSFLNGAAPSGSGIGGSVNILPKRATNEALNELTFAVENNAQFHTGVDVARRFGSDDAFGIRLNGAFRDGETAIDGEDRNLELFGIGLDYRADRYRLSADIGYQYHRIDAPRPSVTPTGDIPDTPDSDSNFAQSWTHSEEEQVFGTLRGEFDISENFTAWVAAGARLGEEDNVLANPRADVDGVTNAYRFDNTREDTVTTGEVGIRGRVNTGAISHELGVSANAFNYKSKNAYAFSDFGGFAGDLYDPYDVQAPLANALVGGELSSPDVTERIKTRSFAVVDTLGFVEDRVLLTVGARHQNLQAYSYNYNTGAKTSSYNEDAVTPMAAVVVKPRENLSLYANYMEGLVKGDVAPATSGGVAVVNAGEALEPYKAQQFELGIKYESEGFGVTLSAFTTDRPFSIVDSNNVFSDGGERQHRGLELMLYGELSEDFRLLGGATYLDTEYSSTEDGLNEGNDVVGVPEYQVNLGAEWDVPTLEGLTLTGRIIHTSSQYADMANSIEVDAWTRFDVGARYRTRIGDADVIFRLNIENLTGEDYWASVGGFPGSNYLVLSEPRTFVLSTTVRF
ncbi:TonB-dependent receptor [Coraliomargarita sp. SDUM461004]|uniref:TonB-dependent receptor n=1 Tax=Thalassobacterium sedimentorum TaxID=3041258 RepID=A0ABU1AHQ6_9BACT|nr:TonB-dependent receptor [Coraliomargarita sp. SDUM461004]MDQ8194349.1 TonB-dependent receptor [Coraliomargarita sp. SDUM461004]